LKGVLNHILDYKQSLKNQGLFESVIIANEVLDDIRHNNKSCIVFKADFEKAYDSD